MIKNREGGSVTKKNYRESGRLRMMSRRRVARCEVKVRYE